MFDGSAISLTVACRAPSWMKAVYGMLSRSLFTTSPSFMKSSYLEGLQK